MPLSLHALLIGIDKYSFKPLNGCVNDVNAIRSWLEKAYPAGNPTLSLNIIDILLNEKATRAGIIAAFDKFKPAEGDSCLLFYSGHGSRSAAPEEFWTEPDMFNESLVCYDSRADNKPDLMDKELAYLLWKLTAGKQVNIIVITDCCHSGNITRGVSDFARSRHADPDYTPRKLADYLGHETSFYKHSVVDGKRRVTNPVAPHFHLAACRDSQKAKELEIDGTIHGAFTHALLRALNETQGVINYGELDIKTKAFVKALTNDQTPSVILNNLRDPFRSRTFLGTVSLDSHPALSLVYDRKFDRWQLNAGSLQGISINDKVIYQDHTLPITKTYADYALLSMEELALTSTEIYPIAIQRQTSSLYRFKFTADSDLPSWHLLKSMQAKARNSFVAWVEEEPNYVIRVTNNVWSLYQPGGDEPVFEQLKNNPQTDPSGETTARFFLFCIDKICRWRFLLDLTNPDNLLIENVDFDLTLLLIKNPGHYDDTDEAIPIEKNKPAEFSYRETRSQCFPPAIRVRVKNLPGGRIPRLFVNAVILQWDYAIIAPFEQLELTTGQPACLRIIDEDGDPTETIQLEFPQYLLTEHIVSVTDYLKIFISTHPLEMGNFAQDSVDLRKRDVTPLTPITRPTWYATTIPIETFYRKPEHSTNGD